MRAADRWAAMDFDATDEMSPAGWPEPGAPVMNVDLNIALYWPRRRCPYGDETCPCQDGDPCNYEDHGDTKAMEAPCAG